MTGRQVRFCRTLGRGRLLHCTKRPRGCCCCCQGKGAVGKEGQGRGDRAVPRAAAAAVPMASRRGGTAKPEQISDTAIPPDGSKKKRYHFPKVCTRPAVRLVPSAGRSIRSVSNMARCRRGGGGGAYSPSVSCECFSRRTLWSSSRRSTASWMEMRPTERWRTRSESRLPKTRAALSTRLARFCLAGEVLTACLSLCVRSLSRP